MKKEISEEVSTPEEKPLLEAVVDEAKQESEDLLNLGSRGGLQIGAEAEKGAPPLRNEDKTEDLAGVNLLDIGGDVEVKGSIWVYLMAKTSLLRVCQADHNSIN